jgi:truncated hemoglobin YjbI
MSGESPESETLHERIGRIETIESLVDSFYQKVLADPELSLYFEKAPMDKVKGVLLHCHWRTHHIQRPPP